MKLGILFSSILWATTLGATVLQRENPSSVEISSGERESQFFYVQAKDDEAADALQRNSALRDSKLSSRLRKMIERADINLADKQEDFKYVRNMLVSLQHKIKMAKLIQQEHANELRVIDVDHDHLKAIEVSAQEAFVANKERMVALRKQAKRLFNRRKQLKESISAILSGATEANLEENMYGKSIVKQKNVLNLLAEKLELEDRKVDLVDKDGVRARKRAINQLQSGDGNARQLEDLSMFDIGKGLILSDKASLTRKEFTKEFRKLQKMEFNRDFYANKIKDVRRQLRPDIIGINSIKHSMLYLKSAENGLQGKQRLISQQLKVLDKLLSRNKMQAKILSEDNEEGVLKSIASEKQQLLTQLGDLYSDEAREREAARQDLRVQQELDHAASLHLLSVHKMGNAAADAADSAAELLAASSLLHSVGVGKKAN